MGKNVLDAISTTIASLFSQMNKKNLSKFLSLVLRHKPEELGISLDQQGWADTQELLRLMQERGMKVDFDKLQEMVQENEKQRFKFSEDFSAIRANQGHSIAIELGLAPKEPPTILFHGTAKRNITSILEKGLVKGNRQHVHLSLDKATAVKVGRRHGEPIVLLVEAGKMFVEGLSFYQADNGVWLTEYVDPRYLSQDK